MKVTARFYGLLGINLGVAPGTAITFDLPEGATYDTLLREIGHRYGNLFPPNVWEASLCRFAPGVQAMIRGQGFAAPEAVDLVDGMEVYFLIPLAGG